VARPWRAKGRRLRGVAPRFALVGLGLLSSAAGCRDEPPRRKMPRTLCDQLVNRWMECIHELAPAAQESQLDELRVTFHSSCDDRGGQVRWGQHTMSEAVARGCLDANGCSTYGGCLRGDASGVRPLTAASGSTAPPTPAPSGTR
jgi:hypothetical protein